MNRSVTRKGFYSIYRQAASNMDSYAEAHGRNSSIFLPFVIHAGGDARTYGRRGFVCLPDAPSPLEQSGNHEQEEIMKRLPHIPRREPTGWYSRGYLPHFDGDRVIQFITFRLIDSIPQHVADRWQRELRRLPLSEQQNIFRRRAECYLDQGYGNCHLKSPIVAGMVQETIKFNDGKLYRLLSWVIMPNHVHLLISPAENVKLEKIMHTIKSYTAHAANSLMNRTGAFWQREYFDRFIRDGKHYWSVISYIEANPVKARLCQNPSDWTYSSANERQTAE